MKNWLSVLFNPSCWQQNARYSAEWDWYLNSLLSQYKFTDITEHTATIGPIVVWIANHPYASFTPYQTGLPCARARRSTILWAWEKLLKDGYAEVNETYQLERLYAESRRLR